MIAQRKVNQKLLIEPCGIEIFVGLPSVAVIKTFNRTLWNWNGGNQHVKRGALLLLIEPCGIEIYYANGSKDMAGNLLIEPCGIEILFAILGRMKGNNLLIEPCGIEIKKQ